MNSIDTTAMSQLDGVTLIDVREDHEYVAGHAPTAVSLPLSVLTERVAEVPRDETVYIICESGGRSAQACQWLEGGATTSSTFSAAPRHGARPDSRSPRATSHPSPPTMSTTREETR